MITDKEPLDPKASPFSWKARGRSFVYAWEGIVHFFRKEHNAKIHLAIGLLVVILSFALRLRGWEAASVAFSIALVWITEMINTVVEKIMDFVSPEIHPRIKSIKDIAAGAVLVAAVAAVAVGCLVFIPKLILL